MKMSLKLIRTLLPDGVDALDAQRHQHRVGVGGFDGLGDRRAVLGLEVDVAADQVDLVADAVEEQHPLFVEVERVAAHAEAAGDGDGAEERLVELVRLDLGVEAVVLLVELEEAVVFLGPLDDLIEVLEFLCRAGLLGEGRAGGAEQQGGRRQEAEQTAFHGGVPQGEELAGAPLDGRGVKGERPVQQEFTDNSP